MAALSREFIRLHRISVQRIGDLGRDRQFLVRFSLIINILAVSLPDQLSVLIFREGLFALYIFHIRQLRGIGQSLFSVRIFQPDTGDLILRTACSIRHDIDRLLTFRIFLPGRELRTDGIYESFRLILIRFSGFFLIVFFGLFCRRFRNSLFCSCMIRQCRAVASFRRGL